jgi:transketolase
MSEQININPFKANIDIFAESLEALAFSDKTIIAVTSDSRGSSKLVSFGQKFPKQIVEVGIAEQNLVGVAAGLASFGKKVFAVSPACFLTARALEQIKNDVAYSNNAVKLIGISAGVSYGALGTTHHSLHDFAALRAINNITIVAPADNFETAKAVELAAAFDEPIYLRFGKKPMQLLNEINTDFVFGKGRIICTGKDVAIIANGEMVWPAMQAAKALEADGISCTVISMHTIKPLDTALLQQLATTHKVILTVEEHCVNAGLGDACASFFMQNNLKDFEFALIGIPDEYTVTGSQVEILNHYGISEKGIFDKVITLLKTK